MECYQLASCGKQLARIIPILFDSQRSKDGARIVGDGRRLASELATHLLLIDNYIQSLPEYWIEIDIEQRCTRVLDMLVKVCRTSQRTLKDTPIERLVRFLKQNDYKKATTLATFFNEPKNRVDIDVILTDCKALADRLSPIDMDETLSFPAYFSAPRPMNLSQDLNDGLFNSLRELSTCRPDVHPALEAEQGVISLRHPARLRLSSSNDDTIRLNFHDSSSRFDYWQEMRIRVARSGHQYKGFQVSMHDKPLCQHLADERHAYISILWDNQHSVLHGKGGMQMPYRPGRGESLSTVLENYDFSAQNKVMLAYEIAIAYWQYYESDLMSFKWSSENIWFMPLDIRDNEVEVPLTAYLTLPFDNQASRVDDIKELEGLVHKYPRLLAIGLLLLEIGLGKPMPQVKRSNDISQANLTLKIAHTQLRTLKEKSWNGYRHKQIFDLAVESCLSSERFAIATNPRMASQKVTARQKALIPQESFYKEVICRLAYLAGVGFEHRVEDTDSIILREQHVFSMDGKDEITHGRETGEFHAGKAVRSDEWVENLSHIHQTIERKRRDADITHPVRIAILDTGCNPNLPYLLDRSRKVKWKDFVSPGGPPIDTFGHGSLMTRVVMECAPFAEVTMVRVAESTETLSQRRKNIADAIEWAASNECKADIISMSFGFPANEENIMIQRVIQRVTAARNDSIIFLASAGNSPTDFQMFPANHSSVISIFATDKNGKLLSNVPRREKLDSPPLGTFGDHPPRAITDEIATVYPSPQAQRICEPGSSIATAVAASISATMLAYASVLPSIVTALSSQDKRKLGLICSYQGMGKILGLMASDTNPHQGFLSVNPMMFFKDWKNDSERCTVICQCLSTVN